MNVGLDQSNCHVIPFLNPSSEIPILKVQVLNSSADRTKNSRGEGKWFEF